MSNTNYLEQADAFIAKLDAMPDAEIPAEPTAVVPTPTFRTAFAEEVEAACEAAKAECATALAQSNARRDGMRTQIVDLREELKAEQAKSAALEEKAEALEAELSSLREEAERALDVAKKAQQAISSCKILVEAVE